MGRKVQKPKINVWVWSKLNPCKSFVYEKITKFNNWIFCVIWSFHVKISLLAVDDFPWFSIKIQPTRFVPFRVFWRSIYANPYSIFCNKQHADIFSTGIVAWSIVNNIHKNRKNHSLEDTRNQDSAPRIQKSVGTECVGMHALPTFIEKWLATFMWASNCQRLFQATALIFLSLQDFACNKSKHSFSN